MPLWADPVPAISHSLQLLQGIAFPSLAQRTRQCSAEEGWMEDLAGWEI